MALTVGDQAPGFELADTEGGTQGLAESGPTVVIFTCNHCPYALAWHDRLNAVARDYGDRARFLSICSNDAERYPADGPDAMRERVRNGDFEMPYLHDADQSVARAYGARTTPDVFLVDAEGRVRYRGAPDADHSDPGQDAEWLRAALDAVLDGRDPDQPETEPVGCSIKWKQ